MTDGWSDKDQCSLLNFGHQRIETRPKGDVRTWRPLVGMSVLFLLVHLSLKLRGTGPKVRVPL